MGYDPDAQKAVNDFLDSQHRFDLRGMNNAKERLMDSARRGNVTKDDLQGMAKDYVKNKHSGCFVTTAVCGSFGKPDNCYELEAFRSFRDNWLMKQSDGTALIDEYYDVAPRIVAVIDKLNNAKAIYSNIWETYLHPCLKMIEAKDYQGCKATYITMVNALKEKYIR